MGSPIVEHEDMDSIGKKLFRSAMKAQWEEVVEIYEVKPMVHKAKITRAGDTALHIAVSDAKEDVVEQLVQLISKQTGPNDALYIENEQGNTPLHIAASLGSVRMCNCIAQVDPTLIGARNSYGETPLFVAALFGKKDAFLCLHYHCGEKKGYSYCRRDNGETILHCAISGDYFDLAFQIIHLYKKLANAVDEHGLSPLHLLASKPAAFRSGSHLGRFNQIIYHCTFVDELDKDPPFNTNSVSSSKETEKMNPPENYETCFHFFHLLRKLVNLISGSLWKAKKDADPEANDTALQKHFFPPNYLTCFHFVKLVSKAMLIVLGLGSRRIAKQREKKEKHVWSIQIMNELLEHVSLYEYEDSGSSPQQPQDDDHCETKPYAIINGGAVTFGEAFQKGMPSFSSDSDQMKEKGSDSDQMKEKVSDSDQTKEKGRGPGGSVKKDTPILIAARSGITEMIEKILEKFPVAIHDINSEKKNIVLLAVENRQPHVYKLLLRRKTLNESVFRAVDSKRNSALHLAATLGDHKPWLIPGAALQMQWEIKWYEFVKNSMPLHFFVRYNKDGQTARDIFTETHKGLIEKGGEWLTNTSESCSVVAALIATVAFATSTSVPGGLKEGSGMPNLEFHPAFDVFAISSLIALCFSVTSVVMFLAILTSRYQEKDFGMQLPRRLLVGLTSLFVSIGSILVSFCAGHFFVLKDKLKYAALPVYAVTCLPLTLFAIAQFPLYFDLARATFRKVPQRSYRAIPL